MIFLRCRKLLTTTENKVESALFTWNFHPFMESVHMEPKSILNALDPMNYLLLFLLFLGSVSSSTSWTRKELFPMLSIKASVIKHLKRSNLNVISGCALICHCWSVLAGPEQDADILTTTKLRECYIRPVQISENRVNMNK